MPRPAIAGLLLLCLGMAPSAGAEGVGERWIRRHLMVDADTPWTEVERRMRVFFFATDVNGGGVTPIDHDLAWKTSLAALRAGRIASWARYDLDGDGQVTRVEVTVAARNEARLALSRATGEAPTRDGVAQVLEEIVAENMRPDRDGDGAVSFPEILAAADRVADLFASREGMDDLVPMALDADGDGVVTLEEYTGAVRSVFEGIDRDGDGHASAAEINLFHQASRP